MWECKYGREPLDTRLCLLRLLKKSWWLLGITLAGAVLSGGIYFLSHVVYGPAREYTAESQFYIEYKDAVTQEQQYTFYNKETWETLIHTDIFMDEVWQEVQEATSSWDSEITREEICESVAATLLTDVRLVHATVTTPSPELTMIISRALEPGFVKFGNQQREIDEIRRVLTPVKAELTVFDNRLLQACILGAVLFFAFALFVCYLYAVLDTSIYVPLEFERRFGIPMELPDEEPEEHSGSVWVKEKEEQVLLYVKSGAHNRMLIEKTIRDLKKEGREAAGAVLVGADRRLIKAYLGIGGSKA